jgi:hypothetical protein
MKRIINTSILRKACRIEYKTEDGFITLSFNEDQTEYTISPIKNSEYLVMILTEGATDGPMSSVCWCDPVDTWLSEGRLSIYDESQMDDNTVFLATLMYSELQKLNKKMKIAQAAVELEKALAV